MGPKAFQWEGVIRIWTRGLKNAQFSKCSEYNENGAIASVSFPDSDGIFIFANGVRMGKLSRSVRRAKQVKKNVLTGQAVLPRGRAVQC